jgi:ribosome biogenesis protein BMS1
MQVVIVKLVHYLGVGDFEVKEISKLPDPCPLPEKEKKRSLNEKEKLLYAPMCGVGGVMYDKVCNLTRDKAL